MQSDALIEAVHAVEESKTAYGDLYDFAPNGYLTLGSNGSIVRVNPTAAALIGKQPRAIVGMPLLGFIVPAERRKALDFLKQCRTHKLGLGPNLVTRLRTLDGERHVQLFSRPRRLHPNKLEILIAIFDLTDQKHAEAERDAASKERELLVGRLISLQEDERRRVARDIHDHLGQRVTGLRLLLELAAQRCRDAEIAVQLADAQEQAHKLDCDLDFFTSRLRPASLDDFGLLPTMAQFVREWSDTFQIRAAFHTNRLKPDTRLDPDIETNLYRITQEALNNAHKHASPTSVSVILERRGSQLVLIVEDDGSGFDLQRTKLASRGIGLMGMRERLGMIGGTLEIESAPKAGTTLFIRVPWKTGGEIGK